MIRIYGVPISRSDAESLVATLLREGGPKDVEAAARIAYALNIDLAIAPVTAADRDAILNTIEQPDHQLSELRSTLQRDYAHRH